MGTRETSHRAEPHRCSHRLLSDASPSRQQAERGVNSPQFDAEVRTVLVDPGAEAGRAELEGYALLLPRLECDDDLFPVCKSFSLTALLGFLDFRESSHSERGPSGRDRNEERRLRITQTCALWITLTSPSRDETRFSGRTTCRLGS